MNKLTLDLIKANASLGIALVDLMVAAQGALDAWDKDAECEVTGHAMEYLRTTLKTPPGEGREE